MIDYAKYYESLSYNNNSSNGNGEAVEYNEPTETFEETNHQSGSGEEFEEDEDVPLVSGKLNRLSFLLSSWLTTTFLTKKNSEW